MNREIPIFFTIDNGYAPFLAVALNSAIKNSSKDRNYKAIVLHEGLTDENKEKLSSLQTENFKIELTEMKANFEALDDRMSNRLRCDYFTLTIYFRLFIPSMFPQYDKALYLDCDTVILGDISELYNYDLGNNLLGGAPCEGVNSFDVYKRYVKEVDGLDPDYFFNAGVILMNLKAFREEGFYDQFAELLGKYKFRLIQDEGYLNVICQDRILRLPRAWNKTPVGPDKLSREDLRIVHYLMTWKPWHYEDIPYQEYFWEYAVRTEFYDYIKGLQDSFDMNGLENDKVGEKNLKALAEEEIARPDGYFKVYGKRYGNV